MSGKEFKSFAEALLRLIDENKLEEVKKILDDITTGNQTKNILLHTKEILP